MGDLESGVPLTQRWQYGRLSPLPSREPPGWELAPIASVARLESGHTPSRKCPEYWDGTIPWVSLHDSKGLDRAEIHRTTQTIGALGLANSSARLLPAGTVVFSRTATVGKATILGREMATSQDFANYVCGPRLHNRYLMQLMRFLQPEWLRLMAGSTHNTIYLPVFENLQLLLPPLPEQHKIAAILSSVDDAIEATQAVIDQLQVVKKAIAAELVTRGMPGRHTKFRMTEIGEVPEEWKVVRVGDVCERMFVGIAQAATHAYVPEGGVPIIRSTNVRANQLRTDDILRINDAFAAKMHSKALRQGDVLSARTGYPGTSVVVPAEFDGAQCFTMLVSRPGPRLRGQYLCHLMNSVIGARIVTRGQAGGAQQNLNVSVFEQALIPLPTVEEQEGICRVINAEYERGHAEDLVKNSLGSVKSALMSVLLTGEVRVTPDAEAAA